MCVYVCACVRKCVHVFVCMGLYVFGYVCGGEGHGFGTFSWFVVRRRC